jgi:peptidoglycan/LPS O-acetylase OafA/YrhL
LLGSRSVSHVSGEPPAAVVRFGFVDGLRGLAALFVLLVHVFYEPSRGGYTQRWPYWFGSSYHRVPVDVFIVLSGFCLMLPIAGRADVVRSWGEWLARRSLRILPPYYAAVLLSLLLSVLVINPWALRIGSYVAGSVPPAALWGYALQIQDLFGERYLQSIHNPPLWSISVEWRIYFLMPLVLWSLRRFGSISTLLWASGFGLGVEQLWGEWIGKASPWYVALFAMGAAAARVVTAGRVPRWWAPASLACALCFAALVSWKHAHFYAEHGSYFGLLVGAGTALFVGATARDVLAGHAGPLARVLASAPLTWLGRISFSLYLLHNPLLRVAHLALESRFALDAEGMLLALLAVSPLLVLAANAFHRLVERPFMHLSRAAPRRADAVSESERSALLVQRP